jgi:Tfp pilus assembly protein PilO
VKGSDKAVVLGVIVAVVLAGFYFKVLSPKREKASSLNKDIAALEVKVAEQEVAASFAEDARQHFPAYYGRLVVLGKAVPSTGEQSSLLVELNSLAHHTGVKFDSLELTDGSAATSAAVPSTPPSSSGTSPTSTTATATASTTPTAPTSPTPATEASAANLPLGAAVGAAGLPTMPYKLTFTGRYFDVADFLKGVDDLVHLRDTNQVAADGRLLTINGFSLSLPDGTPPGPTPRLEVNLVVTSYVTPADQGLTAGATPGGPSSSLTQPQTQPASATVTP